MEKSVEDLEEEWDYGDGQNRKIELNFCVWILNIVTNTYYVHDLRPFNYKFGFDSSGRIDLFGFLTQGQLWIWATEED
jgi:hypothetical protein